MRQMKCMIVMLLFMFSVTVFPDDLFEAIGRLKALVYGPQPTSQDQGSKASNHAGRQGRLIAKASEMTGLSQELIRAVILVESNFDSTAVSHKGAMGLMQIMPKTAKELGISDPFDEWENIYGGSRYLVQLLRRFKGDLQMALQAYNAGPTAVEQGRVPVESREYARRVLAICNRV